MRGFASLACLVIMLAIGVDVASAQQAPAGCSSEQEPNAAQRLRCRGGLTLVAEDGAKFTLQTHGGLVDAVDLQSKAVLVDAPSQKGNRRFQVITPQAIAAVRGTKWAVDAQESRTSVLVLTGQVAVRRPGGVGGQVVLGPGEGVDVEPGSGALEVKRWAQPRVDALLARLRP
ncbi:MAG: FecR domain-containing protein [Bradyrhizobium sp.]|nr:FecR domain-containing protein [Bradyrhizobium sp.]